MKKTYFFLLFGLLSIFVLLASCGNQEMVQSNRPDVSFDAPKQETLAQESKKTKSESNEEENGKMNMNIHVNNQNFTVTLEQNSAVDALVQMMEQGSVTLYLSDYAGFEKVGPLGRSLPTSDRQTTTQAGDIVLYQGDQIVMFYGSNTWSYTRLGHVDDLDGGTGWSKA